MKLKIFLTFVVALTFVIDASPIAQAEGEDNDPVIASFKHCRKLCHELRTLMSYIVKGSNWDKNYVACLAECERQLEKAERKRHPYLYPCQLVIWYTVRNITLILNNNFVYFQKPMLFPTSLQDFQDSNLLRK